MKCFRLQLLNEKVFKSSNLNNRIQSFEENFNSNNIKNKKYNKKTFETK